MKAVIIAAGEGSRLRPYTERKPKPLVKLLGLSLIERIIVTLKDAGISDFVVVTGYKDQMLRDHLGDGTDYGVNIEYAHNPDWKRANGLSVLAAEDLLKGEKRFLLLTADHIFERGNAERLLGYIATDGECVLCVDYKLDSIHDMEDATKVFVDGSGLIRKIGKNENGHNAVDCGMFLLSPAVFPALRRAVKSGADGLTDGVRILAEEGKLKALDIEDGFWVDVDDIRGYRTAKKALLSRLPNPREGVISKHLNRKISTRLTGLVARLPLTPNQVSFISFFIGLAGAAAFALGVPIAGGLLTQLSSIVDGMDGELARLKFMKSGFGDFADSVLDRYMDGFLILGMTYYVFQSTGGVWAWALGWTAMVGATMSSFYKEKYRVHTGTTYISQKYDGIMKYSLGGRDSRLFVIMLGGLFNMVDVVLWIIAITSNALAFYRFGVFRRLLDAKPAES